jgi:menaquinol-cytochrome c reductase cytochrome b/c subunit
VKKVERPAKYPYPRGSNVKNDGWEPFIPNFLLKEWVIGAVFIIAFVLWISFNPVTLGLPANPSDTTFIPMPDWYFYFLYQFLKYFPGSDIAIGIVLVPLVAVLLFMLVPWLDASESRRPIKRKVGTLAMILTLILAIWLTNEATVQHLAELAKTAAPIVK